MTQKYYYIMETIYDSDKPDGGYTFYAKNLQDAVCKLFEKKEEEHGTFYIVIFNQQEFENILRYTDGAERKSLIMHAKEIDWGKKFIFYNSKGGFCKAGGHYESHNLNKFYVHFGEYEIFVKCDDSLMLFLTR